MGFVNLNIFSRIKNYRKLSKELQEVLLKNPDDAPKFQEIFNLTVDRIYQDIMDFERENIEKFESDVYRLRKIFEKRYRRYFLYGEYIKWCVEKPFGYSGDYKIIDEIYQSQVRTSGFDRLWDSWFQQLAASKAVRERKEDFKKTILDFDERALNYAKQLLNNPENVNFLQKNVVRLALKRDIEDEIQYKYDLIYSTGLFDYLDERVAVRLVNNLKKLLKQDGIIAISNFRDKYSNSSSIWMEWIGEWYLVYRTEAEFEQIFLNGGFSLKNIQIIPQYSKVMQYCLTKK